MPAYFERGFFVREPAWHGMGIVLPEYPGRDEAMRLAGHDFTIVEHGLVDEVTGEREDGSKRLVRSDNGARVGVVNASYELVQNTVAWDIVDAVVQQPSVKYDTAGVLKGGALLWVMAFLDEPFQIHGDPSLTFPYVSASWAHDGSGALNVKSHMERIVCANTEHIAEQQSRNAGTLFAFKHTKNVMERIAIARETIAGVRTAVADFQEFANDLAMLAVSDAGVEHFVQTIRANPGDETLWSKTVLANVENDRALIRSYLNGPTCEGIRNTAYGLVQAGIEFLDHGRKHRSDFTLLNRTILNGEPLKDKVVTIARETARDFPVLVS